MDVNVRISRGDARKTKNVCCLCVCLDNSSSPANLERTSQYLNGKNVFWSLLNKFKVLLQSQSERRASSTRQSVGASGKLLRTDFSSSFPKSTRNFSVNFHFQRFGGFIQTFAGVLEKHFADDNSVLQLSCYHRSCKVTALSDAETTKIRRKIEKCVWLSTCCYDGAREIVNENIFHLDACFSTTASDSAPAGEVSSVLHDIARAELITLTFIGTC